MRPLLLAIGLCVASMRVNGDPQTSWFGSVKSLPSSTSRGGQQQDIEQDIEHAGSNERQELKLQTPITTSIKKHLHDSLALNMPVTHPQKIGFPGAGSSTFMPQVHIRQAKRYLEKPPSPPKAMDIFQKLDLMEQGRHFEKKDAIQSKQSKVAPRRQPSTLFQQIQQADNVPR